MTGIAYARGHDAWATCEKCGLRVKYQELRDDGQYKHLRVCSGCFDSQQPQDRLLRVSDPVALWRGTPDTIYPPTAPAMTEPVLIGDDVELAWSPSDSPDSGVAGYRVLRAVGDLADNDFVQIADLPVTRDFIATITNEPLSYTDESLTTGVYSYLVRAYDMRGNPLVSENSNIVSVTVP